MIGALLKNTLHALDSQHKELVLRHRSEEHVLKASRLSELFIFAGCLLLVAAVSYLFGGYHFAFHSINRLASYIPEFILHNITVFGDGALLLTLVLLFANRNVRLHWLVFIAAIVGGIVSNTLKEYFDAARPPAILAAESFNLFGKAYKQHSFPSGHTLTAFLMVGVAFYYASARWQKSLLLMAGILVGLSRIWLGVHWPIDTLVGAALGLFCAIFALWLGNKWPIGINLAMHRFILLLLVVAALILLLEKNDYRLALPLLYICAIAALWRSYKNYLLPKDTAHFPKVSAGHLFWAFLAVITLYRLAVLLQPQFSLFYDEAYYYHWSLTPDFGYYSKPPMVAWFIWLGTSLLGDSAFAVKFMSCLLYGASSIVIFNTLKRYTNTSSAAVGGVVFVCIPMVGFNSEFITTDAPLLFFWSLAVYFSLRAIDQNSIKNWLLLGVFTGLGMLSKYTMGALPLAVFGYLASSKQHRFLLAKFGPWLAAFVAGAIFSSNIIWNALNNWIALQHTQEISQSDGDLFNIIPLFEFWATQLLIFGPVISYLLIRSLIAYKKTELKEGTAFHSGHIALLIWQMSVILFGISIQAFMSRAFPNWAGPWMITATILLALLWPLAYSSTRFFRLLRTGLAINLVLLSMFYHWPQLLRWLDIEATSKNDPFHRLVGWPQLGEQLTPLLEQYPDAILASDSRDIIAYLGFYGKPGSFDFARWNPNEKNIRDYYDLKLNLRKWQHAPDQAFIFVTKKPVGENISSRFHEHRYLAELGTQIYKNEAMYVSVSYLKGFKGYEQH
ncbi:4-amino-4-deoxy-L-arabinose transferase [Alteromonadaceae bacterium Bs31]|nr:4-amino-4-deoxy-L-arabinose transferase [Alteromonadaceae bacterium Bs31]